MAGTLDIPLTTLKQGTHDFPSSGGYALADADSQAVLTLDRTVPGGLNSVSSSVAMQISIFQSDDGGATWFLRAAAGFSGGIITDPRTGQVQDSDSLLVNLWPGAGRQGRAEVTVSGGQVAVQGSLVIT